VKLFESKAIASYIDKMFSGPNLFPDNPIEAAKVVGVLLQREGRSLAHT
jgi:glutathione S-transferase